ncbi:FAD-binding oxidoreductase [Agrobacterium tumefaciens]|uniref:NAD(P)/FAD-dependent oxidoreductase n=1 Tax=Agrobacterium tumefaciens TaxID=358 RepID=UPI0015745535|nr:FAD-binding oxidoreductase [Agrobacterium tumefaciens]NTE68229.1 FAD-binding oxidoreductase [Agrobacterium tumefaciens]
MDILTINGSIGRYPDSYYAATSVASTIEAAPRGDVRCDVCIIGGGYTGVSTALHLAKRGYKVVLLEANRIGWGASGRNGGQVNTGMRHEQETLEQKYGVEFARQLWAIAVQSVERVKGLIAEHSIDCGFKPGVIHSSHRASDAKHFRGFTEKMRNDYGVETLNYLNRDALHALLPSDFYCCGVLDMEAGHLHPLNYLFGLARAAHALGVVFHENARVTSVEAGKPAIVKTDKATIKADFVAAGLNGYGGSLFKNDAAYVMPINGYIGATRPLREDELSKVLTADYAVADSKFVINYFRLSEDKRLLFGGGESYGYRFPKNIDPIVRKPMRKVYPHLKDVPFDYAWGGTLGITMSRLPYFRKHADNIISAGGYSGQGVALATLAGDIIAETIAGQAERFDVISAIPAHRFPGGSMLQTPLLVAAMLWYGLRDALG